MKRKFTQGLALMLALIIVLAGCSSGNKGDESSPSASSGASSPASSGSASPSGSEPASPPPEEVTLQFYLINDTTPADQQLVFDEFYNRTKDTLNTKININWVSWAEVKEKLALKLASGEQVDGIFDAQWNTMAQMIAKETYLPLDKYFNNDEYPGLKKAFPPEYINNNKFPDNKGEEHVYAVPFSDAFGSIAGLWIRKDLREKYGLPEIKSLADLEAFYDKVLENEKGIVPFGTNGAGTGAVGLGNWLQRDMDQRQDLAILAGDLLPQFAIGADGKVSVAFHGDPDFSMMPAPKNTPDGFYYPEKTARKWYTKGYLEKDIISQKDSLGFFKAGKFASIQGGPAGFDAAARELAAKVPGAEMELAIVYPGYHENREGSMKSDFKAYNFVALPANSKNPDRVMKFFDWLFANQENNDLIALGIQGKHWEPVGEGKYKVPDGVDATKNYAFPQYMLTWNPIYNREAATLPESVNSVIERINKKESYVMSPIAGFQLNAEPIKNELTKLGPEFKKASTVAALGLTDDIEGVYKKANERMQKMGLEKVRQEIKTQLEAYLAKNK